MKCQKSFFEFPKRQLSVTNPFSKRGRKISLLSSTFPGILFLKYYFASHPFPFSRNGRYGQDTVSLFLFRPLPFQHSTFPLCLMLIRCHRELLGKPRNELTYVPTPPIEQSCSNRQSLHPIGLIEVIAHHIPPADYNISAPPFLCPPPSALFTLPSLHHEVTYHRITHRRVYLQ